MSKIAPDVLPALLCAYGVDNDKLDRAIAQAKALLSVVRAARRVAHEWDRWDEARPETCRTLHRALARLSRAIGGAN